MRRRVAALCESVDIALPSDDGEPANTPDNYIWGGTGSTTATTDYNTGTNWLNPPTGAPPVSAGQSAIFNSTGSCTVVVTSGPISPDSWTFNANSKSF